MSPGRPRVGISACLLGERVRYDGGHKREPLLADALAPHVEWVGVCPEVELGLGTPRPPIRLEQRGPDRRLVVIATGSDLTGRMARWAADRGAQLRELELAGFVLKARSPSCGLRDAPVVEADGAPRGTASGAFAEGLAVSWPSLPLASEVTLADPSARASFLGRVFAHASLSRADDAATLHAHHERHRLLVASCDLDALGALDELVGAGQREDYAQRFRAALRRVPGRGDHLRALRLACTRAGDRLGAAAREQITTVLEAFAAGSVSLATSVRVVRAAVPGVLPDDAYLAPARPIRDAYRAL